MIKKFHFVSVGNRNIQMSHLDPNEKLKTNVVKWIAITVLYHEITNTVLLKLHNRIQKAVSNAPCEVMHLKSFLAEQSQDSNNWKIIFDLGKNRN